MENLLQSILWLIIIGVVYVVVDWGLVRMGLPDIINTVLKWMMIVFVVAVVVNIILGLVGHPLFSLPKLSLTL